MAAFSIKTARNLKELKSMEFEKVIEFLDNVEAYHDSLRDEDKSVLLKYVTKHKINNLPSLDNTEMVEVKTMTGLKKVCLESACAKETRSQVQKQLFCDKQGRMTLKEYASHLDTLAIKLSILTIKAQNLDGKEAEEVKQKYKRLALNQFKLGCSIVVKVPVNAANPATLADALAVAVSTNLERTTFSPQSKRDKIAEDRKVTILTHKRHSGCHFSPTKSDVDGAPTKMSRLEKILAKVCVQRGNPNGKRLKGICRDFVDRFHVNGDKTNTVKGFRHRICLKPGTVPIRIEQPKLPSARQQMISVKLNDMLKGGIAEPSNSPWNFPLGQQKNKRVVIDYLQLNDVIETDNAEHPNDDVDAHESISRVIGANYISILNLNEACYQIELDEESRPLTAFTTPNGKYQLKKMPVGLKTSTPILRKVMKSVLGELRDSICYNYNPAQVIVYGNTVVEHEENLRKVLMRFRDFNLKLKPNKCLFFHTTLSLDTLLQVINSDIITEKLKFMLKLKNANEFLKKSEALSKELQQLKENIKELNEEVSRLKARKKPENIFDTVFLLPEDIELLKSEYVKNQMRYPWVRSG